MCCIAQGQVVCAPEKRTYGFSTTLLALFFTANKWPSINGYLKACQLPFRPRFNLQPLALARTQPISIDTLHSNQLLPGTLNQFLSQMII